MSQPASVLHRVIQPKPPGQGTTVRPIAGPNRETDEPLGETEDFDLVLGVLVENAPLAMAVFDGRMRYVLANRQWINDFGLQNSLPLVGRSQFEVFPDLHPGWRSVYERALQGHVVRSEHDVMPGPDGKSMIFRWEVRPWRRSKDNGVGGVMVTSEKLATLPQPAEAGAGEPMPSQPCLPDSGIPILVTNVQGLILQANQTAGRIALARGMQLGSSHFWEIFAENRGLGAPRQEVLDVLSRAAAPGARSPCSLRLRNAGQDSPDAVISWAISKLQSDHVDADGPHLLFVGVPGEETPPSAAMDAALQMESRQLGEQLANTAQELRMLQDMERAYKRRELRQREVLDAMPCGLIVLDERGRPTFHNNHVRALFGCELKAGDTIEDWLMQACLDDQHREEVSTLWRESVWRRQLTKIVSLNTADGLVKDLELRPNALGHAGLLLTIHDVTDTCRLEEMLRSTEAKFRAMLHESPVAAVLTDVTGSIFEANAAAEKLLGHPKGELRRMGIDEWLAPEGVQDRRAELQRMAAGRLAHGVLRVEVASGGEPPFHPMQIRLAAVYDADGRLHSIIYFLQPQPPALVETLPLWALAVPPSPEGQIALSLLLDDGIADEPATLPAGGSSTGTYVIGPSATHPWPVADLEREQLLLTEAHHRIKNHLQIISSLLNLQSNTLEDAGARQALRSSQTRVRAIASLHQHLYQLSLGNEISLQEFTDELVVRLRDCYDIPAERVAVTMHLQQCRMRDEWHMPLALILNEAISNAFKHAFPEGRSGTIDIKLRALDQEAHLTIQDNGIGLPANFDGSASPGLGLKVIGVFAEQMQGQVSMENMTDQGLIFDLRFPMACADN